MARQRLRPEKIFGKDDLKDAQKVLREWCGDCGVVLDPFAASDLCEKIAQAIAISRGQAIIRTMVREAQRLDLP